MHFWKSYICSNTSDVQATNCGFAQFNRISEHLFGHWIEIRRVACSGLWDLIVSVHGSVSQISDITGRAVDVKRNQKSQGKIIVMENVILFPQTSSPRVKKFCCMCSKTMKQ